MSLPSQPRVVVTGAGSGLGRALCEELARRKARVLVSDVDTPSAEETALRVTQAGGEAHVVNCDVTDVAQVEALADTAIRVLGGVDLLVNNAGVVSAGAVGALPLAEWKRVLDINLWGVIHGCHVFVPRMRLQGSGHILNIASSAGLVYVPDLAAYNVSKAGVVALSETMYVELKASGIGVTVACPSFFRTNIANTGRYADETLRTLAVRMVGSSRIGPDVIARKLLSAVDARSLYSVPMADARWGWRLRRMSPSLFLRTVAALDRTARAWLLRRG
ncbi:SDR family NAD(P)-dependent oxidoreductase [Comamonas sp. JC664]|uniref:SDR family NAD(P)-dependent oxidoreductase n=1 Tax=Comamonas sp. JC664 TaxID=2801917 RepID=UPI00174C0F7B|nr:SDR family NAD(P)-dependent oxidoreductase [Comamonas sp. JC664]MBL0695118.1 SDR family NAD(P)-dependent oxidoreductase [Comamonas sp. JC664]GHG86280.1 putative short-chain dehydrogenase/reductase [Comamonas sp. KCTC 72670]